MNVTIFDTDYFYKKTTLPNINCMRLSSYHKQKGDNINFVTQDTHLNLAYDCMYISREQNITPVPARKYLDDNRVRLIGKGFKYYGAKELSAAVIACRPDYLLYENSDNNAYTNANFITFYANGKLIKKRQDWHNTKQHHKKTIITDAYFWKAADEEILWCLEVLKQEKNIVFLESISLRKLLTNKEIQQKFLELHFSVGTKFKWKNDYLDKEDNQSAQTIINFMIELRRRTKSDLGYIPIRGITKTINTELDFELELLRCLQIVELFKHNKLKCIVIAPKTLVPVVNGNVIELFEIWTRYYLKLSFVEFIVHDICLQEGLSWDIVVNNPHKWKNDKINYMLKLLISNSWIEHKHLLFCQWGYEEINSNKINYNTITKYINLLFKD